MTSTKPSDLVVWNQDSGYDSRLKTYPTNLSAPKFDIPNVSLIKTEAAKKMADVFNQEKAEIVERVEKLYKEYNDSVFVWESRISFDPVVGHTYYMYNFRGVNTLSLLAPHEWNKNEFFIGAYKLNADRKWIEVNTTININNI